MQTVHQLSTTSAISLLPIEVTALLRTERSYFNYNPIRRHIHYIECFGMFYGFNVRTSSGANVAQRRELICFSMNSVVIENV